MAVDSRILKIAGMDDIALLWNGWEPILRIIIVGALTYVGIILILRISGKRTLSNMNAFDFIITIALGSLFGRILTARSVSVTEALSAFALLALLQYILSYLEMRSKWFKKFLNSEPSLLYYNGSFIERNLQKERILKKDLLSVIRKNQFNDIEEIEAVVLETDGVISVIKKTEGSQGKTYRQLLKEKPG